MQPPHLRRHTPSSKTRRCATTSLSTDREMGTSLRQARSPQEQSQSCAQPASPAAPPNDAVTVSSRSAGLVFLAESLPTLQLAFSSPRSAVDHVSRAAPAKKPNVSRRKRSKRSSGEREQPSLRHKQSALERSIRTRCHSTNDTRLQITSQAHRRIVQTSPPCHLATMLAIRQSPTQAARHKASTRRRFLPR